MRSVRIGSQLFINKTDTTEEIRAWVTQMHQAGLRLIRLFIVWDHVEPREGLWRFDLYDACFERARELSMGVVPTLMAVSPPGWMRAAPGPQSVADLNDPVFWHRALEYVRRVVTRYHDSTALDSWILWNEPSRAISPTEHAVRDWHSFLLNRYTNIDALNARYFWEYESFDQVAFPAAQGNEGFGGYVEQLDRIRFAVADLQERLAGIRDTVREIDREHPVHVNPHGLADDHLGEGQSIWQEAEVVDFLGCSAHPAWHATRFPPERLHQSIAFFCDLIKSASPDPAKRFWVSELQGGTTITSAQQAFCPTPGQLRHWLWESIGSGAEAVVFWCFNTRKQGYEAGEWGLLNQQGRPSERLDAVADVAVTIQKHQDLFDNAVVPQSAVRILYSDANMALASVDGRGSRGRDRDNPRNDLMAVDALVGAYLLCADVGYHTEFLSVEELSAGKGLEQVKMLILPGMTVLNKACIEHIRAFVRAGGTVVADGLLGYKDADGALAPDSREAAADVFGCDMQDVIARREPFEVRGQWTFPGWFLEIPLSAQADSETVGTFASGAPAVVIRRHHKGVAVRIGTTFFQRYFAHPSGDHRRFLASYLKGMALEPVRLSNPSAGLRMRTLALDDGLLCVLLNYGPTRTATLETSQPGVLAEIDTEREFTPHGQLYRVVLGESGIRLLRWSIAMEDPHGSRQLDQASS